MLIDRLCISVFVRMCACACVCVSLYISFGLSSLSLSLFMRVCLLFCLSTLSSLIHCRTRIKPFKGQSPMKFGRRQKETVKLLKGLIFRKTANSRSSNSLIPYYSLISSSLFHVSNNLFDSIAVLDHRRMATSVDNMTIGVNSSVQIVLIKA